MNVAVILGDEDDDNNSGARVEILEVDLEVVMATVMEYQSYAGDGIDEVAVVGLCVTLS